MHNKDHQNKNLHQKSVLDIFVTACKPSYQNEGKSEQPCDRGAESKSPLLTEQTPRL